MCSTSIDRAFPALVAALLLAGCGAPETGPAGPTPYSLAVPAHFPELEIPDDNPMTVEGVALGRTLYYDTRLSRDGRRCAGCHLQSQGFTSDTPANATPVLPHANLGWSRHFLWKGEKTLSLEEMMVFEVADFFDADLTALAGIPEYPPAFEAAFGDPAVTAERAAKALAQFQRTLISGTSKLDRYLAGEVQLTKKEHWGYLLFNTERGDCFHCHGAPLTTDNDFHNTGLLSTFEGEDRGRFLVTGDEGDIGKFKTPSLRNVALRTRFMHDGRYGTLEEVIDHYDSGVQLSPTLDPIMTKPGKEFGLGLSADEKAALVAFLNTFTDDAFVSDPRFADPF